MNLMKTVNYNKNKIEFTLTILQNGKAILTWLSNYDPPHDDMWFWENLEENVKLLTQNDLNGNWKIIQKCENHGRNMVKLERINKHG